MKYTRETIKKIILEENVRYIKLEFSDIHGILKNVEVPADRIDDILDNNVMFDGSSINGFVRIFEADMFLHPDINTFLILSYEECDFGRVARFICDVYKPNKDGSRTPFDGCPRNCLKKNLAKMNEYGFSSLNIGLEPEFFLFKLDENKNATLDFLDDGSYFDIAPKDLAECCRREILYHLDLMGFSVEASHHEVSPSQYEINYKFASALEACDNVQTFKQLVKKVARKHNLHATFMAKPVTGINGSGMHVNCSLSTNENKNSFFDELCDNKLSYTCIKFISGILAHAKGCCLVTNPTINSYKRIVPGFEAPCYISWSDSNRSTQIRIPSSRGLTTRCEVRSVDATSNPYLAISVILASGLDGILENTKIYPPVCENLFKKTDDERKQLNIENLPPNLNEAILEFKKDKLVQNALGEHITRELIDLKNKEWLRYKTYITDFEIKEYLKKF